MNDFTIVNLQDLTEATNLTVDDLLAVGQGDKNLRKAKISQIGALIGVSSSVVVGDKDVEPTVPSFAFADSGVYSEWGNVEIIGDLGILIFDGTNFSKTEINFIANGVVEEGNTQAVSGGEVYNKIEVINDLVGIDATIISGTNFIEELQGSSLDDTDLWESGAYWRTSGAKDETSEFFRTKKLYKLYPGDYVFRFELVNNNYGYCFYDENGVFQYGGTSDGSDFNITLSETLYLGFSHRSSRDTTFLKAENINDIFTYKDSEFVKKDVLNNLIDVRFEELTDLEVIPINTNFIEELQGSDLNDPTLWADGYLHMSGDVLPGNYWHTTTKYYLLKAGYYDFNLYFTGNAKMIFYNLDESIKEVITNPSGSELYDQSLVITEDVLVRFSYRQSNELPNVNRNLSIINTKPVSAVFITTSNINDYLPDSGNSAIRQLFLNKYRSKKKRPIVTIISDDGWPDNLEWFVPILDEFGVKATFAMVGNRIKLADEQLANVSINSEQTRELYLQGHDIASHTWTHTQNWGSVFTLEQIEEEMSRTKVFLEKLTNDSVNMFISPFGIRDADIDNIISKYYDANFISGFGSYISLPLDNYVLTRTSFDANETTPSLLWETTLKPAIDDAIENNRWLVLAIHPQYSQYNSWENKEARKNELRILLQYCKDNNIEVTTAKKAYNYYKNHVDIGVRRYDSKVYQLGMDGSEYNLNYFDETI